VLPTLVLRGDSLGTTPQSGSMFQVRRMPTDYMVPRMGEWLEWFNDRRHHIAGTQECEGVRRQRAAVCSKAGHRWDPAAR